MIFSAPSPAPPSTPFSGPASPAARFDLVDILRGVALLGILLVNMEFFASPIYFILTDLQWGGEAGVDPLARNLILFLAQGKFYVLFSFLFGWGLAVQIERGIVKGVNPVPLFQRRMFLLFGIGFAHVLLLWHGDILIMYSLLGLVLLLFRYCRDRTLLICAALFLLLPILWTLMLVGLLEMARALGAADEIAQSIVASETDYRARAEHALEVYRQGGFLEIVGQRFREYWFSLSGGFLFGGVMFHVLGLFLIGFLAGRRGYLSNPVVHRRMFRRLLIAGFLIGVPGNVVVVWYQDYLYTLEPTFATVGALTGVFLGGPALSMFYVCSIVLLAGNPWCRNHLRTLFAGVGRTALSNYLLQSLVATSIFYGYGLGLYGHLGPAVGMALTLAIFTVQVLLTRWWLGRYRFGPMEWVWRSLTYKRRQPMRLTRGGERPPPIPTRG